MSNPGFNLLKAVFNEFTAKYDGKEILNGAVRSVATGAKQSVDALASEFPDNFVRQAINDVYNLITDTEVASGISESVAGLVKPSEVKEAVTAFKDTLKDPAVALEIATKFQTILTKTSPEVLDTIAGMAISKMSADKQEMAAAVYEYQIKPTLNDMREMSPTLIAGNLKALVNMVPTDMLVGIVQNSMQQSMAPVLEKTSPETISKIATGFVAKLPSADTITNIVHGIAQDASDKLGQIAQSSDPVKTSSVLKDFAANATDLFKAALVQDKVAKSTFKPGKPSNDQQL